MAVEYSIRRTRQSKVHKDGYVPRPTPAITTANIRGACNVRRLGMRLEKWELIQSLYSKYQPGSSTIHRYPVHYGPLTELRPRTDCIKTSTTHIHNKPYQTLVSQKASSVQTLVYPFQLLRLKRYVLVFLSQCQGRCSSSHPAMSKQPRSGLYRHRC